MEVSANAGALNKAHTARQIVKTLLGLLQGRPGSFGAPLLDVFGEALATFHY
jgi:hypothetical protein